MLRLLSKKAQSTAEYAILIGLVVAAVIGMQTYVKRGIQARQHDAADELTAGVFDEARWQEISPTPVTGESQFEPDYLEARTETQAQAGAYDETTLGTGGTTSKASQRITQDQESYQVQHYDEENQ
ncbi:hypothetical protein ACFL1K_04290 [Candidatus Omnitrophota bacterium]